MSHKEATTNFLPTLLKLLRVDDLKIMRHQMVRYNALVVIVGRYSYEKNEKALNNTKQAVHWFTNTMCGYGFRSGMDKHWLLFHLKSNGFVSKHGIDNLVQTYWVTPRPPVILSVEELNEPDRR